jgi:lipoprotein-anchoring transpeptidase ErfK/SrfK
LNDAISDQTTSIGRRNLLSAAGSVGLITLLSGCAGGLATQRAPNLTDGIPFALNHDYASEPHDVRLINRARFDPVFAPVLVQSPYRERPGTIVVNAADRLLFLVEQDGVARRYGVAVGDAGYGWAGRARVGRKSHWPAWHPTPSMRLKIPELPWRIAPGADNPLGARALYLFAGGRDTLYRIHGTSEPWTIGTQASSGCIRMFNEDVIDLYDRVRVGAEVVVIQ